MLTLKILSQLGGTTAGLSATGIFVNSSEKLLVSNSCLMRGTKGGSRRFSSNAFQLNGGGAFLKKGCSLSSSASRGPPPSLCRGSLVSSRTIKLRNVELKYDGIGGSVFRILLEISCCELSSTFATVKGDEPVNSSYVNTPMLHQSTACNVSNI